MVPKRRYPNDSSNSERMTCHERRNTVNQRHSFAQKGDLGRFPEQGSRKGQKTHRLSAQPGGEGLQKTEAAMFRRDRKPHGNRAQDVTRAIGRHNYEETKAYARKGREDGLDADSANEVDQQRGAEHERNSLHPRD